ncbi:hypothetical protein J7M22_15185 [Candidatus Poribacteria bacterium]|nr:hypothetical protein [Candidatus Poribacteria bacterium]
MNGRELCRFLFQDRSSPFLLLHRTLKLCMERHGPDLAYDLASLLPHNEFLEGTIDYLQRVALDDPNLRRQFVQNEIRVSAMADLLNRSHLLDLLEDFAPLLSLDLPPFESFKIKMGSDLHRELIERGASEETARTAATIAAHLISSSLNFSLWVPLVNLSGEGELFRLDVLVRPSEGEGKLELSKRIKDEGFRSSLDMAHKLACYDIGESYDAYLSIDGIPQNAQLHGGSMGLAVAIAIEAAAMGRKIGFKEPGDLAVTGALDGMGRVLPVSDIRAKVQAVLRGMEKGNRINAIVVPKRNLEEAEESCWGRLQVIGVDSLPDLSSLLLEPWVDYLNALSASSSSESPSFPALKGAISRSRNAVYLEKAGGDKRATVLQIASLLAGERLSFRRSDPSLPPIPIPVLCKRWRDKLQIVEESLSRFGVSIPKSLILSDLKRGKLLFISPYFHPEFNIWVLTESEWRRERGRIPDGSVVISDLKIRSTCFDEHIRHVRRVVIPNAILTCRCEGISFEDFLDREYMRLNLVLADDPNGSPITAEEAIINNRRVLIVGDGGSGKSVELLRIFVLASKGKIKVDLNGEEIQLVPVYLRAEEILRHGRDIGEAIAEITGEEIHDLVYTPGILLLLDDLDVAADGIGDIISSLEKPPFDQWLCLGAMRSYTWLSIVTNLPPSWVIYRIMPPEEKEIRRFLGFNPGRVNLPILLHLMRSYLRSNEETIPCSRRSSLYRSAFQNWMRYELPDMERRLDKVGITSNNLDLMLRRTLEELAIHCLKDGKSELPFNEAAKVVENWIEREIKPRGYFPPWWACERVYNLCGTPEMIPIGKLEGGRPDRDSILIYLEAISSLPFLRVKDEGFEFIHDEIRDYWAAEWIARKWNEDRTIQMDLFDRTDARNAVVISSGFALDPEKYVQAVFNPSDLYRTALAAESILECELPADLRARIITALIDHLAVERFEILIEGLKVLDLIMSGDVVPAVLSHLENKDDLPSFLELALIRATFEKFAHLPDRDKKLCLDQVLSFIIRFMSEMKYLSNREPMNEIKSSVLNHAFMILGSSMRSNPDIQERVISHLKPLIEAGDASLRARALCMMGWILPDRGFPQIREVGLRGDPPLELRWSALAKLCGIFRDEGIIPHVQALLNSLAEMSIDRFRFSGRYGNPEETMRLIRRWALHDLVFFFGYREEVIRFIDGYVEALSPEEKCELVRAFVRSGWGMKRIEGWIEEGRFPIEATPILVHDLGYIWRIRTLSKDMIRGISELVERYPEAETPFERWTDAMRLAVELPPDWGIETIDPERFHADFTGYHRSEEGKRWWIDGFKMILSLRRGEPVLQQRVLDLLGCVICDDKAGMNERLINMSAVADIGRTLFEWARPVLRFLANVVALQREPILRMRALKLMSIIPEITGYALAERMIERTIDGDNVYRQLAILPEAPIACGPSLIEPIYELYRRTRSIELRRRIAYSLSSFWRLGMREEDEGANERACDILLDIAESDPEPTVRLEAIYSFARIAPSNRLSELRRIFRDNVKVTNRRIGEIAERLTERWF